MFHRKSSFHNIPKAACSLFVSHSIGSYIIAGINDLNYLTNVLNTICNALFLFLIKFHVIACIIFFSFTILILLWILKDIGAVLAVVIFVASINYFIIIIVIPMIIYLVWVRKYFVTTTREVKRIEGQGSCCFQIEKQTNYYV